MNAAQQQNSTAVHCHIEYTNDMSHWKPMVKWSDQRRSKQDYLDLWYRFTEQNSYFVRDQTKIMYQKFGHNGATRHYARADHLDHDPVLTCPVGDTLFQITFQYDAPRPGAVYV